MPSSGHTIDESSVEHLLRSIENHEPVASPVREFLGKADQFWNADPQPRAPEQLPRQLGRFRLLELLGEGGFGLVYLAEETPTGKRVALKLPRPEKLVRPEWRERFLREARAAAVLTHANIVRVYDAGEIDGQWYISTSYIPGPNLAQWLAAHQRPVDVAEAAQLLCTLAGAMAHAHERGVIHRDLKPSNILLQPHEGSASASLSDVTPCIADFGLAKLIEESGAHTVSGVLLGTLQYMAPEQAGMKRQEVGPATDIYALGLILYEVLAGKPVVPAEPVLLSLPKILHDSAPRLRSARPECPADLETIYLKCLEKNPRHRYASAQALHDDLKRFLQGQSIVARPVSMARRLSNWVKKEPVFATVLLFSLLTLMLVLAGVLFHSHETEQSNQRIRAALHRTQQLHYLSSIQRAAQLVQSGEGAEASQLLRRCRDELAEQDVSLPWEWRYLWNRVQQMPRHYLWYGHHATPYCLALAPDGLSVASSDGNGDIIVRQLDSETIIKKIHSDDWKHNSLCFNKDGRYLAVASTARTGSSSHRIHLWNISDWTCSELPLGPEESFTSLCFHPNRDSLLITLADANNKLQAGRLTEWEYLESRSDLKTLASPDHCQKIFWSPGLKSLILVTTEQFLLLDEHYQAKPLVPGPGMRVTDAVISPNGQWFAWASLSGQITLYDLDRSRARPFLTWRGHEGWIRKMAFNNDSRLLASCGAGNTVQLWDVNTGKRQYQYQATGQTEGVCFSLDGKSVLFGSAEDFALHRWYFGQPAEANRGIQLNDQVWSAALSPDGRSLIAGLDDDHSHQTIRYLDLASEKLDVHKMLSGHSATITGIVPLAVPDRMVSSSIDGELLLWDTRQGEVLRRARAPNDYGIRTLIATDKGVAAAGQEGWIRFWDSELEPQGDVWRVHAGLSVPQLVYDRNRNQLLSAGCDGKVCVWDFTTHQLIKQFETTNEARCLALSHDGKTLAYGAKQGIVYLADRETGKVLYEIRAHSQPVCCLTFTPDDLSLISADFGGELKCWQVPSGEPLFVLQGHQGRIHGLIWNQDGSKLYSTGHDGKVMEHDFRR